MLQERFDILAAAAQGRILRGVPDLAVRGHFTDTRSPVRGGLFVALRGENFDGNKFAREAVERHGAAAVLVDNEQSASGLPENAGAILVADTRNGFLNLAAAHRARMTDCIWFGVTGSVGKSTTKEMLAHILAGALPDRKVHKARGSFNNAVGLSHTILETSADAGAAVLELGTNHPGEIEQLAAVARPQIAIITCAAESHLEAFETVENVAREKATILKFQNASDTAILNADDHHFPLWRGLARGKILAFGLGRFAELRASAIELDASGCARFLIAHAPSRTLARCALRVPGSHMVSNALAAIGAAITAGATLEQAATAAGSFEGLARRFTVFQHNDVTLIDDAYNANPASFRAALETLGQVRAERKFVVAGGMLELGTQCDSQHHLLGTSLARMNLDGLLLVGELARMIGDAAIASGMNPGKLQFLATPEDAATALGQQLRPGDAVLIKGSHGIHLDRCVAALRA